MLFTSRYQDSASFQRRKGLPLRPTIPSLSRRARMASQDHIPFSGDSSSFPFDFRLQGEASALKPSRDEPCTHPLEIRQTFSNRLTVVGLDLSTFSGYTREQPSSQLPHPYDPPRLQIPSGPFTQDPSHSPSNYIPSAVSEHSCPPFLSSTGSRSLSPGDNPGWTDDSSSSAPPDHSSFESFAIATTLDQPHPSSASILPPPPAAQECRASSSNGKSDSRAKSNESDFETPVVKLGPNGLAEDQPPTAQGKMRTRVYVACLQWLVHYVRIFLGHHSYILQPLAEDTM